MTCVVGGCSVGHSYTRPTIPLPAAYRVPTDTTTSLADLDWWRLFQDSVLQELIATALNENTDVRLAIARVRESRAQFVEARGAQFPQLDVLASYVDARLPSTFLGGQSPGQPEGSQTIRNYTGVVELSYDVDVFGRLRETTRAARADHRASASDRQAVLITVISDVAQAYFDLLELDQLATVTRRTIASREGSLDLVRRRFTDGLASELDVSRAQQELASATAVLPRIQRQTEQTENRLSILLGKDPGPIPRGVALDGQTVPPEIPAGLPSTLLERRPDIREAEARLVAANARSRAAVAELFPRISLTAVYGGQNEDLTKLLNHDSRLWAIVPMVRLPLFHGGTLRGDVNEARAREEEAVITYQNRVQRAFQQVDDALTFNRTARDARNARETEVSAARRALELANLRYTEGIGDYLDVLDAERQLFSAEIDLTSSITDQLNAVVQLYQALGGGWDVEPQDPRR